MLGSHAPQHLQQLSLLRSKLKVAGAEPEALGALDAGTPHEEEPNQTAHQAGRPASLGTLSCEGDVASPAARQRSSHERAADKSPGAAAANAGGTVSGTVSRLTREAAEESAAALARVKEEQRRLQALNKELVDLQRENEALSRQLSSRDVRALREQAAQQHAALREAQAAEAELRQLEALSARLPQMRAEAVALGPAAAEAARLEAQLQGLREADARRVQLTRDIASLQPKVWPHCWCKSRASGSQMLKWRPAGDVDRKAGVQSAGA